MVAMGSPLRGALHAFFAATLLASGCGTTSSTSVNAPSARCAVNATAQPSAVGAPGGTGSITITTDRECAWEAHSEADWLALSAASGRGDGTLRYTASGNPAVAERRGAVVVNGSRVEIGQAAAVCEFGLARGRDTSAAAGGSLDGAVAARAGCQWTAQATAPWVTIAGGSSGRGGGVVAISVAANTLPTPRSTTVTIAGHAYVIDQAPASDSPVPPSPTDPQCQYSVSPLTGSFGAEGGVLEVSVVASQPTCTWTAASSAPWIAMEGGVSQTGSGMRRFIVAPNTTTSPRTGLLGLAGAGLSVTQAGAAPQPNPNPDPGPTPPPPSPPPPSPPPPEPPPPTPPPPTPPPTPPPPTPPPACSFAVTPNPVSVGFAGQDDIELRVTTTASCAWTAVSQASWITISGSASGTGDGRVRIAVASTLAVGGRTGTLSIGGQTVTVNQGGILDQQVTFSGAITNRSGSCPNLRFSIGEATVVTDGATDYMGREDCSDLASAGSARVRGIGQANGTIRATRIDRIDRSVTLGTDDPAGFGPLEDRP
jgi:hypothetical protein